MLCQYIGEEISIRKAIPFSCRKEFVCGMTNAGLPVIKCEFFFGICSGFLRSIQVFDNISKIIALKQSRWQQGR